jgi:hypothetical protein
MANFNNLTRYRVTGDMTKEYDLGVALGKRDGQYVTVVLTVAPANSLNPGYLNEALDIARKEEERVAKRKGVKVQELSNAQLLAKAKEAEEADREIYPRHVIKGWSNVFDDDMVTEVPFSLAECAKFVKVLPEHIFTALRIFCQEANNFQASDAEALAKN